MFRCCLRRLARPAGHLRDSVAPVPKDSEPLATSESESPRFPMDCRSRPTRETREFAPGRTRTCDPRLGRVTLHGLSNYPGDIYETCHVPLPRAFALSLQ